MYRIYDQVVYQRTARGWVAVRADDVRSSACITIPTSIGGVPVAGIAEGAFSDDRYIETLVVAPGATFIGAYAFASCPHLAEIWLPDTVRRIGEGAFRFCRRLRFVILPWYLKRIREETLFGCNAMTFVALPEKCEAFEWLSFLHDGKEQPRIWAPRRLTSSELADALAGNALTLLEMGKEITAVQCCRYRMVAGCPEPVRETKHTEIRVNDVSRDGAIRACLGNAVADAYARPWAELHA